MMAKRRTATLTLLLAQFKSALVLILRYAAALSLFLQDNAGALIIISLRKAGNAVGYMGDGIDDASALHAAELAKRAFYRRVKC
jgi:magnesium-transporting ATPase (P-type)